MADPTVYEIAYSFTGFQASTPDEPLPATALDNELQNIETSLASNRLALMDIRRSDGTLQTGIVTSASLAADLLTGIPAPGAWVTATAYTLPATVFEGPKFYLLKVAHTSGTFATDLAAGKWEELADFTPPGTVAASAVTFAPAGTIAAISVQAALEEVATDAATATAAVDTLHDALRVEFDALDASLGDLAVLDTVGADQIDALAVTGPKIAADAVALSQMAHGAARGNLFFYGASGAPTELPAGTSGQFLQTLGVADPAWAWGAVIQTVYAQNVAATSITATIPFDDTLPQSGEGTQILTAAITPKSTAHRVRVEVTVRGASNGAENRSMVAAVFRGSTCIDASFVGRPYASGDYAALSLLVVDSPASVAAQTYTVRVGITDSGTFRLNSDGSGRLLGGASRCSITLTEII